MPINQNKSDNSAQHMIMGIQTQFLFSEDESAMMCGPLRGNERLLFVLTRNSEYRNTNQISCNIKILFG